MLRCSPKAYAQCPDRHLCGPIEDATFTETSECAAFNRSVEDKPITSADHIQAMGDKEFGNVPLTLDQLREMSGEPVWIEHALWPECCRWEIVEAVEFNWQLLYCRGRSAFLNYGKDLLAYRQKPEVATK